MIIVILFLVKKKNKTFNCSAYKTRLNVILSNCCISTNRVHNLEAHTDHYRLHDGRAGNELAQQNCAEQSTKQTQWVGRAHMAGKHCTLLPSRFTFTENVIVMKAYWKSWFNITIVRFFLDSQMVVLELTFIITFKVISKSCRLLYSRIIWTRQCQDLKIQIQKCTGMLNKNSFQGLIPLLADNKNNLTPSR